MYKKVDAGLNFVQREAQVLKFWKENKIFERTVEENKGKGKTFTFYDGPPTANGKPHIGHVLTRSIKDIIPRYKVMKGYSVLRKAGWDTHGLPVELEVEKELGMDGKHAIESYGIEPFIKKCKESVWKYKSEWEIMSDRVGFWADMEDPYITYDDKYIESVWWAFSEIYKKGLLYNGYKVVPYCPRCGTALASHEVAQGYKMVKEKSIFVKFEVKGEENTYFIAWTTTPWTLPSNVALYMSAKEDYTKIKVGEEYYILADALIESLFEEGAYEKVETNKGSFYEGKEYNPLFNFAKADKKSHYIVNDDYVTLTDGSGIVHIAPAFGEDDSRVGRKYDLPFVQLIGTDGKFVKGTGVYEGVDAKAADKSIILELKERGLLFKELMHEHNYPHCWRCDTPLIYYARNSWMIKMTEVKDQLIKNNNSVNWIPKAIGEGRMGNFLENVIDWGVSRERYWGTPLPIWMCDKCGKIHVISSKEELKKLGGIEGDIELHRPYVDEVMFKCDACDGTMKRVSEVADCWFDSGSMPFAQFHYPFENKELFEQNFPADFISEAVDQTRGWFYTLLAISTLLFDKAPFKNCIVMGHVNDKNGIKMSKHKGNVIAPNEALDKQGADAIRWYFYTSSAPWLPSRYSHEAVSEYQRKFMGTLWNTYAFYVLYADIDGFDPTKYDMKDIDFTIMDKWVISKLNSLIKTVDNYLSAYNITDAGRAITEFTDDLSNWYVRRSRERFWGKGMGEDKTAAFYTLYYVLSNLIKIAAPFTPFMTEEIYQNLVRSVKVDAPLSVHLCSYPVADEELIDSGLEEMMDNAIKVVVLGRSARANANIKNRQPLSTMYFGGKKMEFSVEMNKVIEEELNVKNVLPFDNANEFISYELKPNFKTLGKIYGKNMNAIKDYLAKVDAPEKIVECVSSGNAYAFTLENGVEVSVKEEDLVIKTNNKEGYVAASDYGLTVVLDTALTEELIEEGIERELVSKIQTMRKDAGFEVVDRIIVGYKASDVIANVINKNKATISRDVLAVEIKDSLSGYEATWDINGNNVLLSVEKA